VTVVHLLVATTILGLLTTLTAFAQTAGAQSSTQNIEELRRRLAELEKEVKALRQSVTHLEEQQMRATQAATAPPPQQPAGTPSPQGPAQQTRPITDLAKQDMVKRDRETIPRIDNKPVDPELTGFFRIPGTPAKLKIDGYAKLDVMIDPRPAGDPDEFITTTIPVNLTPSQKVVSSNVIFRESRINLDFRTPVKEGADFRFYAEVDFFGAGGPTDPRLRHLYGQIFNVLTGHTWTTFTDPDTIPDTLDDEGPAGRISTRQAQFRYTQPFSRYHSLAFSIERPGVEARDITLGGGPYSPMPDFVVRYRYERERWHAHLGSLYRLLGFRSPTAEDKAFGWGLNFAAGILFFKRDNLLLNATYGEGIARYISNLDALELDFDLNDEGTAIKALPVVGGYAAYEHHWTDQLRSTVSFGYDRIQNTASQPPEAFNKSYYASGNLIWRPYKQFRHFTIGAEFLYGWQKLKDGSEGTGNRVQVSLKYDLYRKPKEP